MVETSAVTKAVATSVVTTTVATTYVITLVAISVVTVTEWVALNDSVLVTKEVDVGGV